MYSMISERHGRTFCSRLYWLGCADDKIGLGTLGMENRKLSMVQEFEK